MRFVLYKLIDLQEYIIHKYFQFFDESIVSIRAYSKTNSVTVYHMLFCAIYPLRFYKANEIVYEEGVLLEIVHNKNKTLKTTIVPSKDVLNLQTSELTCLLNNMRAQHISILDFSLNNISMIKCFNALCHSFHSFTITTQMFAHYAIIKHNLTNIKPPYEIEIIDNDFAEHTFKENETIQLNKPHAK